MNSFLALIDVRFEREYNFILDARLTTTFILPPARQHPRHVATRLQILSSRKKTQKKKNTTTHPPMSGTNLLPRAPHPYLTLSTPPQYFRYPGDPPLSDPEVGPTRIRRAGRRPSNWPGGDPSCRTCHGRDPSACDNFDVRPYYPPPNSW